ncbi:MAG: UDP-glucose 4-epimerase GalE [candidate division WOR-3 bacterium]|nr:UDP-glucose 4-epimerase GalE [candidate division WOR-3 bacterium]MCX7757294.1 UDP-glucose 4-epimerase GalE [candidate division WOR-3 bacterium]MDW7988032.1 UDP-glucose 4-epimerase GalE [candidate division WOR-3 bacterium]
MKKDWILVTGGAGYIGSVTCKLLLEQDYPVIVIDNLSSGSVKALPRGVHFFYGNIGDKNLLYKIFRKYPIRCVIHFAALIRIEESVKNPQKYFDNNFRDALILLETAAKYKCPKFIYSSTAAVYGIPNSVPITENAPLAPINPYGQAKKLFELVLLEYTKSKLISGVILRYFNVAGAYITCDGMWGENHKPESHLIPLIIEAAHNNKIFTIYGRNYATPDGTCIRDYIHVYDLATAHIMALNITTQENCAIYNVGTGQGYSNYEVLKTAEEVIGKKIKFRFGRPRKGDCPVLIADPSKIKNELGFRPLKSDLKTIIKDAWTYYKYTKC